MLRSMIAGGLVVSDDHPLVFLIFGKLPEQRFASTRILVVRNDRLLLCAIFGKGALCERLLELSPDDRAAAALFYTGYQAARFGSRAINVGAIPNAEEWAESYCAEHPGRPAVEAFRQAYRQTLR
jgi:hypothetical protein